MYVQGKYDCKQLMQGTARMEEMKMARKTIAAMEAELDAANNKVFELAFENVALKDEIGELKSAVKVGDYIYTPRFCNCRISAIVKDVELAESLGFTEPTHYVGNVEVYGKRVGENRMIFCAVRND